MTRWISTLTLCLALGCGGGSSDDSDAGPQPVDAASPDAGMPDAAAPDAGPQTLSSCLDRPGELPRPPARGLGCDLLPPGKTLIQPP